MLFWHYIDTFTIKLSYEELNKKLFAEYSFCITYKGGSIGPMLLFLTSESLVIVLYSFGTRFDKLGPREEDVSVPNFVVQILFALTIEFFIRTKFSTKLKDYKIKS